MDKERLTELQIEFLSDLDRIGYIARSYIVREVFDKWKNRIIKKEEVKK